MSLQQHIKAVSYLRFSSENQRDESIDAQRGAIEEYAEKHNYLIVKEYADRAKSARSDDRPEFLNMVQDSKNGEFSVVIVDKLDRFSRNRFDSAYYKQQLKTSGVTVVSVKENIDGSPESVIMESVLEGFAEYYSLNLARETMKGLKENAYQAKATGGKPPYGFKINPETKLLEINPDEAPAVKLIFKRMLEGVGSSKISEELFNLGYKTRNQTAISPSTIGGMLKNQKYCGTFVYNKSSAKNANGKRNGHSYKDESEWIVIEGGCPAIVSKEDFEAVQRKIEINKGKFIGHKANKEYILSGKLYCGGCGEKYHGESRFDKRANKEYILYVCSAKKKRKDLKCTSTSVHRDKLESAILKVLAKEIFCKEMEERVVGYYNQYLVGVESDLQEHLQSIKSKIKGNNSALEGVLEAITKVRSEALFGKLARLEEEKGELQKLLADAQMKVNAKKVTEEDIKVGFSFASNILKSGKLKSKKELIEKFIDRVEIYDDGIYVKLNFSRFRETPPPNPYKDLPIKEQIEIARQMYEAEVTGDVPSASADYGGESGINQGNSEGKEAAKKNHQGLSWHEIARPQTLSLRKDESQDKTHNKTKFEEKDVFSSNKCGGERGIRTLGGVLAHTRFPIVRLRPAQPSLRIKFYRSYILSNYP